MYKLVVVNSSFLPDRIYIFLFSLLGLVLVIGLFVPLMDNDAAHHANIALRMHLTGDYVNLVDMGNDYLDKPHLHFWLSAFCYKLFGVTPFAYKFPSLLFTILGLYSTYRLGSLLYDRSIGKMAALILASAFGLMLSNSDVRMDAILTACIAFASWQLILFIQHKHLLAAAGAALGLALGFCTKGHIAVFVPLTAAFFYLLGNRNLKNLIDWKWLLLFFLFCVFISPVIYCYYLQFNLHPEKVVRGKDHINGVKFILADQVLDRFTGKMEKEGNSDHFFFLHSFFPAFAPWSILTWIAIARRLKHVGIKGQEWATVGVFFTILLLVSFAGYQLPHYLNVVFPFAAILVAKLINNDQLSPRSQRILFGLQTAIVVLLLMVCTAINAWAFPVTRAPVIIGVIILLSLLFYFYISKHYTTLQKTITVPVAAMVLVFFLLNSNFYPRLMKYQGGNELAGISEGKADPADVYFWGDTYSSSYNFHTRTTRKQFADSVMLPGKKIWLLYDVKDSAAIKAGGYINERITFNVIDYEITMLDLKFIDPAQREKECTRMILSEIRK